MDISLLEKEYPECNHELFSKGSTLIEIKERHMVKPGEFNYFCLKCKKFFKYIQENGEYYLTN